MKVQRIGDALLRSHPSPLLSFLAPSVPLSTWTAAANRNPSTLRLPQCSNRLRSLATKSSPLQAPTTATVEAEDDTPEAPSPTSSSDPAKDDINSMLNFIPHRALSNQTPRLKSRLGSSFLQTGGESSADQSSADLMKRAFKKDEISSSQLARRQGGIADNMVGVNRDQQVAKAIENLQPLPPPVRLDAFVGRSQNIIPEKGINLGGALRRLDIKLSVNKVRQDHLKQRFHERAGLKRKRLKSERWRRRFKAGFQAVVAKVEDMRRRGW